MDPRPQPIRACIALGSNLGDRDHNIREGLRLLSESDATRVDRVSSIIETAAVKVGAAEPGEAYLNAAAVLSTQLGPRLLLDRLHAVEAALGRDRAQQPHGAARTLDLDLLTYGDQVIDEPGLRVPHPAIAQRRFVLEPLVQIAPEVHVPGPGGGATVAELLGRLKRHALVLLIGLAVVLTTNPHDARAQQPLDVPAGVPLEELAKTYQQASTIERVSITIRAKRRASEGQPSRTESIRSEITVRIDPGDPKGPRPRAFALDLGPLRLHAADGKITVVAVNNPETFWQTTYDPQRDLTPLRLGEILQPVPLPELALVRAASDYERLELLPWIGPVTWDRVPVDPRAADARFRIRGHTEWGAAELTIEPSADKPRLARMWAFLPSPKGAAIPENDRPRIDLALTALPSEDPATWKIDTAHRRQVASLRELARLPDAMLGQRFPVGALTCPDGSSIAIAELFEGHAADIAPGAGVEGWKKPVFLILTVRRPAELAEGASLDAGLAVASDGVKNLADRTAAGRVGPVVFASVLAEGTAPPKGSWTYWLPAAPIAKLAPREPLIVAALDSGGIIRAVAAIDLDEPPSPEALVAELGRVLFPDLFKTPEPGAPEPALAPE